MRKYKTPLGVVRAMLRLFEDEGRWTKNVMARDKYGAPVYVESNTAYCFCVRGALVRFSHDVPVRLATETVVSNCIDKGNYSPRFNHIMIFNDDSATDITKVRALLRRTVEKLEKKPNKSSKK